ncbi:MAG: hypothetical protein H3Z50_04135 [archaeon]|nr:hypothetical protein [archaeon]MCP8306354.1 hypothetical protein [archaeon]
MVTTGKIFIVKEEVDLETIALKLKDFRTEENVEFEDRELKLIKEISDIKIVEGALQGIYLQDRVIDIYHRGEKIPTIQTIEAPFIFSEHKGTILLSILEKKLQANSIANQLSKILFITTGHIVEARINPEIMKNFHEQNFEDTKVVFFDDVDIPNVNKLSLYGSSLVDTALYNDYCSHGKVWYVVVKPKRYGFIAGVTRDSVVTIFSRVEKDDFINYVTNEIYPLILKSKEMS